MKDISNHTKVHTQYFLNTGDSVPGVTTVLALLEKPAIHHWIAKITKEGYDWTKYRDKMADIGTITHLRILHHLSHTEPDLSEYSQQDIATSENCMTSFYEWEKTHKLEPLMVEIPITSDIYGYGGTPDYIGIVNGELELLDFKTGNAIYYDYHYQLAAYRQLATEQGHKINHARILRIGRDANEGFEERLITSFDNEFQLFLHCLGIYNLLKTMKRSL